MLKLKTRPDGFLGKDFQRESPMQFDYIKELHEILWRFVRAEYPGASGDLTNWIPPALNTAEHRQQKSA